MEEIFSSLLADFSQRAAMEEAFAAKVQTSEANVQAAAANRMARSSGQLTKIATIIVPCTFVLLGWVLYKDDTVMSQVNPRRTEVEKNDEAGNTTADEKSEPSKDKLARFKWRRGRSTAGAADKV